MPIADTLLTLHRYHRSAELFRKCTTPGRFRKFGDSLRLRPIAIGRGPQSTERRVAMGLTEYRGDSVCESMATTSWRDSLPVSRSAWPLPRLGSAVGETEVQAERGRRCPAEARTVALVTGAAQGIGAGDCSVPGLGLLPRAPGRHRRRPARTVGGGSAYRRASRRSGSIST